MSQWQQLFTKQRKQQYFQALESFISKQKSEGKVIFPAQENIYQAFDKTPFENVKVVILGQDPYHGPNQAHGLSFSVQHGIKAPPSLVNIYKELANDIPQFEIPQHGYLEHWANQGVLLLNTVLTVEQGKAHSHAKAGWETFTDAVIEKLNQEKTGIVFLLWGSHAQKKGRTIDTLKHVVLTAAHPSPLSAYRGFFGCQHFSKTNQALIKQNLEPIDWQV